MEWWGDCCEQGNLQTALQAMQEDCAHCIADGSFEESFGAAAFQLMAHSCNPQPFAHANQMPRTAKDVDPFWAEMGGITGCLKQMNWFCRVHNDMSGRAHMGCDCDSVLICIFEPEFNNPNWTHYDLMEEVHKESFGRQSSGMTSHLGER